MPKTERAEDVFEHIGRSANRLVRALSDDLETLRCSNDNAGSVEVLETCLKKSVSEFESREWDTFRNWHLSTGCDESLCAVFASMSREVEESVELFFMDLASASETCSGDFFNEDTHDSFYLAAREVNAQGIRVQLEFLRDNAPSVYGKLLDKAGLSFVLPRLAGNN